MAIAFRFFTVSIVLYGIWFRNNAKVQVLVTWKFSRRIQKKDWMARSRLARTNRQLYIKHDLKAFAIGIM